MRETEEATGFVLRADPQGEYDKRLVLLTRELGRITVFARGARRTGSPYLAVSNPFSYATFSLYEGRNAYTLGHVSDPVFFDGITKLDPGVYYGYYFLELAQFYGQENLEASAMVNLLYTALRALLRGHLEPSVIRRIYECRMMTINGDFAVREEDDVKCAHALTFCTTAPMKQLFSFSLREDAMEVFSASVDAALRKAAGQTRFRTLAVLESIAKAPGGRD